MLKQLQSLVKKGPGGRRAEGGAAGEARGRGFSLRGLGETGWSWYAAWGVLLAGFLISGGAALAVKRSVDTMAETDFASRSKDIRRTLTDRLNGQARVLLGGAAFIQASDFVSRQDWHIFTELQKIEKQLPGTLGLGFAQLVPRSDLSRHLQEIRAQGFPDYAISPAGDRDFYTSIVFLEPFSGRNLRAFGYDMYAEPIRRAAMDRARDTDSAALSGKVRLVQETHEDVQAGTLMYVPVYKKGLPDATVDQRRAALLGWVYSPCRMKDWMHGVLGGYAVVQDPLFHLEIYDGDQVEPDNLLFAMRPLSRSDASSPARFMCELPIDFNGQKWTVRCAQAWPAGFPLVYLRAWLTLAGCLLVSLLLFVLILVLSGRRAAAQRLAEALTQDLQRSEDKYRVLIENSHDIIYTLDTEGGITFVSPSWTAFLGHACEQVVGRSFQSFVHPDDRAAFQRFLQDVLTSGQRQEGVVYRMCRLDGSYGWHTSSAVPVRSKQGAIIGLEGTGRDITERKQIEESLCATTARLTLAVRAGKVGIWEYNVVENVLVWDDQMFRLYGISKDQFGGAYEAWQAGLHPDDRARGDEHIQLALRGEKDFDIDFRVVWPAGTVRHIHGFALVQRDAAGRPTHLIGTNWDITEQKLAEENIRHQASLINSLLDSIPDIIFFKDTQGIYLGCNPPFAEFVGRPREQIIGLSDHDLFDKAVADFFVQNDRLMLQQRTPRHNEEWITYPDGRRLLIDTLKTPYVDADGRLIGILGISRDITARHQAEVALRESEANFRTFFETMTDMILVATPEGKIVFSNDAVPRTLGYDTDELKQMHLLDLHPAEVRAEAAEIAAAMFTGERKSCPLPLSRKDGRLVPVETRIWLGKWNGIECLFGLCKNLSDEQEAKQRFERLFNNNPCSLALTTLPERVFVEVNDAFLKTLGYAREEVIGNTSSGLHVFVNEGQQAELTRQLADEGRINDFELQVRRKDGTILDGLFSGETVNSQGHKYLMTVMIDITARKRTEAELARLSEIQHALMLLATEFVNVPLEEQNAAIDKSLSTMGALIHADRAYLFEYNFEQQFTRNTHEWCAPGISPEIGNLQQVPLDLLPDWVAAHKCGKLMHIPDVLALPADDHVRQILEPQGVLSLIALPLMQGSECLGFVGFDAVAAKRAWRDEEIALLQVLSELYVHFEARFAAERRTRELQAKLTQARDAAQEAALAKSLFLANMSHEIRTPLNAILGYAQIMGHECLPRACAMSTKLSAITRSGEHLLELLNDLLEIVRSDSHDIKLSLAPFDLYQAVEDVRLIFQRNPAAQALRLTMAPGEGVPQFICSDSGKFRQVLVNLVGNALKFTPQGGVHVTLSVLERDPSGLFTLAVDVEDTGCGIAPEESEHIFELFYTQANGGYKIAKGTGLGLPLSRRYARALGGDLILVRSALGVGSCFRFTFRATESAGGASLDPVRRATVRLAADQGVCRVLIVDDDQLSREMLQDMLSSIGFAVEAEASAAQALQRLSGGDRFNVVLMDKRMPEMSGYDAIRKLRAMPGCGDLAVLVVSASGSGNESAPALAVGANGFVAKPVRREQLLEEIARVTEVRYEYEAPAAAAAAPEAPRALTPEALAALGAELRGRLSQAVRRGDILQLRKLVDSVALEEPALAGGLRALVDAYDYGRLRALLGNVEGGAT